MVDWNQHAVLAHPDVDIACWLPSLRAEGGPAPEEIVPHGGPWAAVTGGHSPNAPAPGCARCSANSFAHPSRGRRAPSDSAAAGPAGRP